MNQFPIENQIEALLFYKNEPVAIKQIAKLLGADEREVREGLKNLERSLDGRGICLIQTKDEAGLATSPGLKGLIEKAARDEMSGEIGKAGLETLAIVLYKGPVTRRQIDFIRGVNSTFILRNLCMRGLIERETDVTDQRIFRYRGSIGLLAHLGLKKVEELPDFGMFNKSVEIKESDG